MGIPKPKFRLTTLIAAVTLSAVVVWAWPIWQRYHALRSLVRVVDGRVPSTNDPVEGAVEEVNRLQAGELALESLRSALDNPNYSVRYNALIALRRLDLEAEAKIPLFVQVLTDEDKLPLTDNYEAFVRCTAAGSLALIGPQAKIAIPDLNSALRHDCPRVGDSALYALQQIDPGSIDPDALAVHAIRKKLWQETSQNIPRVPLVDVVDIFGIEANVAITADWSALNEKGITGLTPIRFQASHISYGEALKEILNGVHATYEITPSGILISPDQSFAVTPGSKEERREHMPPDD